MSTTDALKQWQGRFPQNEIISLSDVNRPFNLAESTSQDLRLGELFDLVGIDDLYDLNLGYSTSAGSPALRQIVGQICTIAPECVLTTQGVASALALLALEVCRPGDEVALPMPCFPPSRDVFLGTGAIVRPVRLDFDRQYTLDVDAIAAALSSRTKLVIVATPLNPGGVQTPESVLRDVMSVMTERAPDAWLFVDETFREATYGESAPPPSAAPMGARVLTAGSVSKAHGAPGLRVGWITVPDEDLHTRLTVAKLNIVLSNSKLDEELAARLLQRRDAVLAPRRAMLAKALALLEQWQLTEVRRLDWVRPDSGAMCCFRLRSDVFDDRAVSKFWALLPEQDLQLASGEWFGESVRVFRLGFGYLPIETFRRALQALSRVLDMVES
jgi:aspartate/methionine/tyrosine aminotransferase